MRKGALHRYKLPKGKPLFAIDLRPKLADIMGMAATLVVREVGIEVAAFHEERQRVVDSLGGANRKGGVARADAAAAVDVGTGGIKERGLLV